MGSGEIQKWRSFEHPDGTLRDLSFLDAHEVTYIHSAEGKVNIEYRFFVTYSSHCFSKAYVHQKQEEQAVLMYATGKEKRPFCERLYQMASKYLRDIICTLGQLKVIHAGYGSYATVEVDLANGETGYYFVVFKAFREEKKFRLHVTSAYPVDMKPAGAKVSFFVIARNLKANKPLPQAPK